MSEARVIKKYPNRRLYDTVESRYITLADIRRLVTDKVDFVVVDKKTQEDITRSILLQVIAEQEQFGKPILSTPLLESIIRFYGNGMQEFMTRYLEKSVETFAHQQETLQAQVSKLMANAPMTTMAELAKQNLDYWTKMQESMASAFMPMMRGVLDPKAKPAAPTPPPAPTEAPAGSPKRPGDAA